jgi:SPOR domain
MSVGTPPPAGPAAPELPTGRRCPRCGAGMTDQQEWCLNCGAAVGTRVVAAPGWRTPIAIAGVILALAAIAVAVAIVQLADDTGEVAQNPPAAAATPAQPPAATPAPTITPEATLTPDPTLPEASGQETPEPTTTPDSPTGGSSSGSGDATWPASKSGWTVVLASDTSESDARDKAEDFAADGIAGVGVLDSDDFSSLRSGFWVVFAGQYDSQSEASAALDGIDARDAYIRRIEPA